MMQNIATMIIINLTQLRYALIAQSSNVLTVIRRSILGLGKKFTKEHVRKISLGHKGKSYNKKYNPTDEHKRKISITRKKYVMTKEQIRFQMKTLFCQ
jgi:hypothetical protein